MMGIYYLPRLAAAREKKEVFREMQGALNRFVPLVMVASIAIYTFRHEIVKIVLGSDFGLVADLMPIQLIGDTIRVVALIFGNYMWAKGQTAAFIVSEIALSWLYGAGCLLVIHLGYGAIGCVAVFAGTYLLAALFYCVWVRVS